MPSVAIETLGCKVNRCESEGLAEALGEKGYTIVDFRDHADFYIINTCTVTGKTDYQSRQLIRRAHRQNPSARIVVTGCYAQTSPEAFRSLPGVSLVAGTKEKASIPELLESLEVSAPETVVSSMDSATPFSFLPVATFRGHTRGFLKIQDGCDAFCSYCIIPYARGRSRSLAPHHVIRQIQALADNGYKEIVLTGIHLGRYGHDLSPATDLLTLLKDIEELDVIERLRISSIEPVEITNEFIKFMQGSPLVCPHLHIPLQSGDDAVLSRMNRNYTTEDFTRLIDRILEAIPDAGIGIDVMAGFPGETEDAFARTTHFIESLDVAYLHMFPYSPRPGTEAFSFSGTVPDETKKRRARTLRAIGRAKRQSFNRRFLNRRLSVLIEEKKDPETGYMRGFSENYIPLLVEGSDTCPVNRIIDVVPFAEKTGTLVGRITDHG